MTSLLFWFFYICALYPLGYFLILVVFWESYISSMNQSNACICTLAWTTWKRSDNCTYHFSTLHFLSYSFLTKLFSKLKFKNKTFPNIMFKIYPKIVFDKTNICSHLSFIYIRLFSWWCEIKFQLTWFLFINTCLLNFIH